MELESLIKTHVTFTKTSTGGFCSTKCPICNDYQARLGIKFEHGSIGANCFNCGFKTIYTEIDGRISKKFRTLLIGFNIDEVDIDKCLATSFFSRKKITEADITLKVLKQLNLNTPQVEMPAGAILLKTAPASECKTQILKYLADRKFTEDSYTWYYVPATYSDDSFKNRIIIPYYRNGKLIYWQARSINPFVKKRYLNCEVPKAAVMFGYDELYSWTNKPLFITEGVFDAIAIGGVCILGSSLSAEALSILKKTKRRVIFVIDKDHNGKRLAEQVISEGWELTFAPPETDDINDAFVKRGKLFTVYYIMTNTVRGFLAKTKINMMCKRKSQA